MKNIVSWLLMVEVKSESQVLKRHLPTATDVADSATIVVLPNPPQYRAMMSVTWRKQSHSHEQPGTS